MPDHILSSYWARAAIRQKELIAAGYGEVPLGVLATCIAFEDISDEEYEANLQSLEDASTPAQPQP
jgi:hypothetical protein